MNRRPRRRARGIKQITRGLGTLDRELFEAIAETDTPLLDTVMPPLTRAADNSKLWFAIAAVLMASGKQSAQRGATRGVVTLAATSLVTNQVAKRIRRRPRPGYQLVPLVRQVRRRPLYHELQVPEFSFAAVDGPTVIACDGEVGDEYEKASFSAKYRVLPVFRPCD